MSIVWACYIGVVVCVLAIIVMKVKRDRVIDERRRYRAGGTHDLRLKRRDEAITKKMKWVMYVMILLLLILVASYINVTEFKD